MTRLQDYFGQSENENSNLKKRLAANTSLALAFYPVIRALSDDHSGDSPRGETTSFPLDQGLFTFQTKHTKKKFLTELDNAEQFGQALRSARNAGEQIRVESVQHVGEKGKTFFTGNLILKRIQEVPDPNSEKMGVEHKTKHWLEEVDPSADRWIVDDFKQVGYVRKIVLSVWE